MSILVIALLKDSQVRYKLEPLAMSSRVERLYLIRKREGPKIPKLKYIVLPSVCKWRPFYLIIAPLYAIFFAWAKETDFILAYHLVPHGVFAFVASLVTGRPFIYSQIDLDIQNYTRNKLLKKLILLFLKKAEHFNVPGSYSKQFWVNLGIKEDKINILHSTIDTKNSFFPTGEEKEYDFVYVGELNPRKQVNLIIDAAKELILAGHNVKLAIIGDGPAKADLIQQTRELGILANVHFLGHKTNICYLLNKSKIFVLISRNEGLPCALMEAMACGLLAVASNVADIPDILIEGETGYLVRGSFSDSVTRALERALLNYEKSGLIRMKAREKIMNEHSYNAALKKWNNILERIAAASKI
jgi:glycosyltransferase involved in cell wall biosynthesis